MKNIKRVFSIVLTVVMLVVLSTAVFADLDKTPGTYTYEVKVTPETAKAGDEVAVEVYLYKNDGSDFTILKDASSSLTYKFTYPVALFAVEDEYEDIVADMNYGFSEGDYTFSKSTVIGSLAEQFSLKKKNVTFSKDTYIGSYTFKVADDVAPGEYTITMGSSAAQEKTTVVAPDLKNATLTIEGSTPEPTKYTVKFVDGDKEESSVEYEEGATIVAPKDPTPAIGKAFDGWYNGEEKFAEGTTATANVTYTAKYVDVAADAPATGIKSEGYEDAAGYTNVWVGRYTATPAANTVLKTFGVAYGEKTFDKENLVEGGATVEFSVALVGVPTDVTLKGAPFATADWAK